MSAAITAANIDGADYRALTAGLIARVFKTPKEAARELRMTPEGAAKAMRGVCGLSGPALCRLLAASDDAFFEYTAAIGRGDLMRRARAVSQVDGAILALQSITQKAA